MSDWRRAVEQWSAREGAERDSELALLFELRALTRAGSQWVAPIATTADSLRGDLRLGVRPVSRGASGGWVRGELTWNSIGFLANRLALRPEQVRWFQQFAALHRAGREGYLAQEKDWLYLEDFASPLLWPLLGEASELGISLVTGKHDAEVRIAAAADVRVEVSDDAGGLRLESVVLLDERPTPPLGLIGDHGVYSAELEPLRITLARTNDTVALPSSTRVPASEREEFLRDFYPRLARRVTVSSTDVQLPEVAPPRPRLTATFEQGDRLRLVWDWDDGERRDIPEEFAAMPGQLTDVDAAEFATTTLRDLERRDDITVAIAGSRPPYRLLLGRPELTITTVESHRRDWFDLGVVVTVEGHEIPFAKLFSALSRGRTKIMLVDKSYLSLTLPVFDALRELIEEAAALEEWDPKHPQISRYQASYWEDFEDLADVALPAVAWRELVTGLSGRIEPVPVPEGLNATLRPYQRDALDWLSYLYDHRLGGILADDMGLGKTLEMIALMARARTERPFLVVAPTSVIPTWLEELARFAPGLRVQALTTRRQRPRDGADVVVTSYAILRLEAKRFQGGSWAALILDEAQFVKNPASRTHQAALDIDAPVKFALTGTPLENSLHDLWALFRITSPGLFPSRIRFTERVAKPVALGSVTTLETLRRRIRPFLLRRTKEQVAADLPPRQEQVVHVELDPVHRDLYDLYLQRERQKLLGLVDDLDRHRFIVFRSLTLLRMLALDASLVGDDLTAPSSKLDALLELLEPVVAEGHRALVFSQFTSYLAIAQQRLTQAGIAFEYLDGSTVRRDEAINRFRDGDAPVFLISLKAGGFGLTLTEADYVFLLDPWWNPAAEQQAIDRTHRIGQSRPVNVYRLVAANTIEAKVMALRDEKARMIDLVLEGGSTGAALTADDIRALLD